MSFICHIHNYTEIITSSITSNEMCTLHLSHPSAHTLGAVGSRHCCARGAVGGSVPCSRVSPQSWTIPAGAKIQTPTTSNYKSNALSTRPRLSFSVFFFLILFLSPCLDQMMDRHREMMSAALIVSRGSPDIPSEDLDLKYYKT